MTISFSPITKWKRSNRIKNFDVVVKIDPTVKCPSELTKNELKFFRMCVFPVVLTNKYGNQRGKDEVSEAAESINRTRKDEVVKKMKGNFIKRQGKAP